MKNAPSDSLTTFFYLVIAWLWLPGLSLFAFHSVGWLADGLAEIPQWILLLVLSSLSLTIACYIHCKKNKLDGSFLSMPFTLFLVSTLILPFSRGYTKALSDGSPVAHSESNADFVGRMSLSLDAISHALLTCAPVIASITAIVIVISHYWPNLRNKQTG